MVLKQRQEDFERQKINVIIELRGQVLCGELKAYMYLNVLGEYVYTGQKHSVGLLNSEYNKEMFSIPIINFKPWLSLQAATVLGVVKYDGKEEVGVEKEARKIIGGRRKKGRPYVVIAIKTKLEGKKTAKTSHGKLLTIWRAFGDLVASRAVGKEKEGNTMAGLLSFVLSS
jgi:hypothetical protein